MRYNGPVSSVNVSPDLCAHFRTDYCRSCTWIDRPYAAQLAEKERLLAAAFPNVAREPIVPSPLLGFRNRVKLSVSGSIDAPIVGLLGREAIGEFLDEGRPLLDCPIQDPDLNRMLAALPDFLRENRVPPYRIADRTGEMKGIIAYRSPGTGEMILRFVLRSRESITRIESGLPSLRASFPKLVVVTVNVQPVPHAILEGKEEIFLTDARSIAHALAPGDPEFRLGPQAFVQTNATIARSLYATAGEWIAEIARPEDRFAELFAGIGAFSFAVAPHVRRALGIEINADAVRVANETAAARGLPQLVFLAADAGDVGGELARFAPDLLLANPPRRGLGESLPLVARSGARAFVYSSCNPETLRRDAEKLSDRYRLKRVRAFDLFPHTEHFEVLAEFTRD